MPVAAKYFVGTVNDELVCHLAVSPFFQSGGYRATRMVVLPEWQGAGVGVRFLNEVCQLMLDGKGLQGRHLPTLFHTSHPQLCGALRRDPKWEQTSAVLYGDNKAHSCKSIGAAGMSGAGGFGGHFRPVQGFRYIGVRT